MKEDPAYVGLLEKVKVALTVVPLFEQDTEDVDVPLEHDIEEGSVGSEGNVNQI